MDGRKGIASIQAKLQEGMALAKCRKCGCMREVLEALSSALPSLEDEGAPALSGEVERWRGELEPMRYTCLGCSYCYAAEVTDILGQAFPEATAGYELSCAFEAHANVWPPVPGDYYVLCNGQDRPVAVSTLGSVDLADRLATLKPKELSIVGKTETENIGIDKLIKNTITNPSIRFLILAGNDPAGHQSGRTLLALAANGVDERMRVVGSPGKRPILKNLTREEVEVFRSQVEVLDMIGCEDPEAIVETISGLHVASAPT